MQYPYLRQAAKRGIDKNVPYAGAKIGRPYRTDRYSLVAITLHWLIAALIFSLFVIGWYFEALPKGSERSWFIALHKSLGITVFGLIVLRLVWRLSHRPPPLPRSMPLWEQKAAMLNHYILYALMFVQPISGYLSSSFSGYTTRYFGIPLPQWGWKDETLNTIFNTIHVADAYLLFAVVTLHVLAALRHLFKQDGIFRRMLP